MPTSRSSSKAKKDEAQDEEQLDELVEDDAQQEYIRIAARQRICWLRPQAPSISTLTSPRTHFAELAKEQE